MKLREDGTWTTRDSFPWWMPLLMVPMYVLLTVGSVALIRSDAPSTIDRVMGIIGVVSFTIMCAVALSVAMQLRARSLHASESSRH